MRMQIKKHRDWQQFTRAGLGAVGFIILIWTGAAVLNAFVFQSYYVDGLSMSPSLSDDDRLIVSKVEKTSAAIKRNAYVPERGQIVILDSGVSDYTAMRKEDIVKRVIGLPGDTVEIKNGRVFIYNQRHPDGFDVDAALGLSLAPTYSYDVTKVYIPEGRIFVLGDNRAEGGSFDSRSFGLVETRHIQGRLLFRVLPLNHIQVF